VFETNEILAGVSCKLTLQMYPRRKWLLAKRARKDVSVEGSSAPLQVDVEFDGHRFRSEEHQRRFEAIKGWSFLKERWV